jgi:hypothetical protein
MLTTVANSAWSQSSRKWTACVTFSCRRATWPSRPHRRNDWWIFLASVVGTWMVGHGGATGMCATGQAMRMVAPWHLRSSDHGSAPPHLHLPVHVAVHRALPLSMHKVPTPFPEEPE